jgi:SAM-dependent methyltransferase
MATDIAAIIRNLEAFYGFQRKSVLHVGAGGGQFIGYAAHAARVVGVDPDPEAVDRLKAAVNAAGLQERFHVLQVDLMAVTEKAEVVFFEFCLHEIADPAAALRHAHTLAPQILVVDHAPASRWSWYCGEEEKVVHSWEVVDKYPPTRAARFLGKQLFLDYGGLEAKIGMLGEPTTTRIAEYRDRKDIEIAMPYRMALLTRG